MILEKGKKYATKNLRVIGWTGYTYGYNCWDYFDSTGVYYGPDENGVEPEFETI
jgi:hypothetical protein